MQNKLSTNINRLLLLVVTIALGYTVYLYMPNNLSIILFKSVLLLGGAVLGYWIDVLMFPHYRPREFKNAIYKEIEANGTTARIEGMCRIASAIQVRRALIIVGCCVTMGIAL